MDFKLDDILRLKKKHPCGSYQWQVVRLGADIGLKCLKCNHRILIERGALERLARGPARGRDSGHSEEKGA